MEDILREIRLKDGKSFFCPNGHSQHFTGSVQYQLEEKGKELLELQNEIRDLKADNTRMKCIILKQPVKKTFLQRIGLNRTLPEAPRSSKP